MADGNTKPLISPDRRDLCTSMDVPELTGAASLADAEKTARDVCKAHVLGSGLFPTA